MSGTLDAPDPTLPGGKLYDIRAEFGRGKEMRDEDRRREKLAEENQERQAMSRFGNDLAELKLKEKALARIKKANEQQGDSRKKSILNTIVFDAADSKVIEASRMALQERKRQAEIDSDSKRTGGKKFARRDTREDELLVQSTVPTGSYRSKDGDVKVLSDISSKVSYFSGASLCNTLLTHDLIAALEACRESIWALFKGTTPSSTQESKATTDRETTSWTKLLC